MGSSIDSPNIPFQYINTIGKTVCFYKNYFIRRLIMILTIKKKLTLDWKGYYGYSEQNVSWYVPAQVGVYVLAVQLQGSNLRVFYVGQASDLRERLYAHLQSTEPNSCIREYVGKYICHFKFAFLYRQEDRDAAERALYFHYRPACNDPNAIPKV